MYINRSRPESWVSGFLSKQWPDTEMDGGEWIFRIFFKFLIRLRCKDIRHHQKHPRSRSIKECYIKLKVASPLAAQNSDPLDPWAFNLHLSAQTARRRETRKAKKEADASRQPMAWEEKPQLCPEMAIFLGKMILNHVILKADLGFSCLPFFS